MPITEAKIRTLMSERGIDTVKELAKLAHTSRQTIYEIWETDGGATLDTLRGLAKALKVGIGTIVEDEPFTPGTPYDTNRDYRAVVDSIVKMSATERKAALAFIEMIAGALRSSRTKESEVVKGSKSRRSGSPSSQAGQQSGERAGDSHEDPIRKSFGGGSPAGDKRHR
jgi:transcriptional regulator with XRE-family HTH domain